MKVRMIGRIGSGFVAERNRSHLHNYAYNAQFPLQCQPPTILNVVYSVTAFHSVDLRLRILRASVNHVLCGVIYLAQRSLGRILRDLTPYGSDRNFRNSFSVPDSD